MRCVNGQSRRGERESQLTINCNFYNASAAATTTSMTLAAKDNFANCFNVGHTLDTINDDAASARLPLMTVQCHFFKTNECANRRLHRKMITERYRILMTVVV